MNLSDAPIAAFLCGLSEMAGTKTAQQWWHVPIVLRQPESLSNRLAVSRSIAVPATEGQSVAI